MPFKGETDIFIKPGWNINSVDGLDNKFSYTEILITCNNLFNNRRKKNNDNYTNLRLIRNKLRFFSYGDACLIWNKNGKV